MSLTLVMSLLTKTMKNRMKNRILHTKKMLGKTLHDLRLMDPLTIDYFLRFLEFKSSQTLWFTVKNI